MSRRHVIICVMILVAALLGLWLWPIPNLNSQNNVAPSTRQSTISPAQTTPTQPSQSVPATATLLRDQTEKEKRKSAIANIIRALNAPISFYGKVVDQHGEPVPDAEIIYKAADKFMASGSSYNGKSDVKGFFGINGINGFRLSVAVRKEGYYFIYKKSNLDFAYGTGPDGVFLEPPTKDNPAVFLLQKMGQTEPLIANTDGSFRITRNGTPLTVDLTSGRVSNNGQLKVEAWTEDQNASPGQPYNWKCRVSVPGGGLVERKGQFDFQAPLEGYRTVDEISMPQDMKRWSSSVERQYFLKLADNRYARIEFKMIAGGDNFFLLESYLNPIPGSRNLEYDPKKVVVPIP